MARLPNPGSDDGTWGGILNEYLDVAHNSDGTLLTSAVQHAGGVTAINGKTPVSGSITLAAGDIANAADTSSANVQTFSGNLSAPAVASTGLTGAVAASRYVGATVSGAPTSGTFVVGDFVIDHTAAIWICTVTGSPGTWGKLAGIDTTASDIKSLGTQAAGSTGKAADAGHVHPTTGLVLQAGSTMSGYLAPAVVNLTFGATIAVNAALGNVFAVTLTSSSGQLANPTNPLDGQLIRFRIKQDSTGGRTLTYGTAYDFGAASAPTLSTAANKVDVVSFEYNAGLGAWCYFGSGLGY